MSLPDLGTHQLTALKAIVEARRQVPREDSFWNRAFFGRRELPKLLGTSLTTLKQQGFIPEDFIEHEIPWSKMPYSIDNTIAFGFTFDHMLAMHFQPQHFAQLEWRHYRQLRIDANDMMKTCLSIHDLVALNFTPQQLHQLKWTWTQLTSVGATTENINMTSGDQQLYFQRSAQQAQKAIGAFKF